MEVDINSARRSHAMLASRRLEDLATPEVAFVCQDRATETVYLPLKRRGIPSLRLRVELTWRRDPCPGSKQTASASITSWREGGRRSCSCTRWAARSTAGTE